MKIAVAGTGYVGLSVALLLSQHNEVHALDIVPEKVELLNNGRSPIVDPVITEFLEKNTSGERPLNFHATINAQEAYTDADFAVIATPTNYDEKKKLFRYVQRRGCDRGGSPAFPESLDRHQIDDSRRLHAAIARKPQRRPYPLLP